MATCQVHGAPPSYFGLKRFVFNETAPITRSNPLKLNGLFHRVVENKGLWAVFSVNSRKNGGRELRQRVPEPPNLTTLRPV